MNRIRVVLVPVLRFRLGPDQKQLANDLGRAQRFMLKGYAFRL